MKTLKNIFAFFLCFSSILILGGCSSSDKKNNSSVGVDGRVLSAIEIISNYWNEKYDEYGTDDKYLEIINTRIINIKENSDELFKDVDYIVEFTLFSNYYDTSPYYSNACVYDSVTVYDGGETAVSGNLFNYYRARTYKNDFSELIESIEDFGGDYNQVVEIK